MVDLRDSHVELPAQPIFETAHDHSLVLQGLCVWDVDVQSEKSDNYHLMKDGRNSGTVATVPEFLSLGSDVGHHFLGDKGFDLIADLHVVEVLNSDAALIALGHL